MQENIGGANIALSNEELRRINTGLEVIKIVGDRYPKQMQKKIGK